MNPIFLAPTSLPNTSVHDMIDAAAFAGFDGVGLRVLSPPSRPDPLTSFVGDPRAIFEIKHKLADSGLAVLDIYTFYLTETFDYGRFARTMDCGAELGARHAVVVGRDPDLTRASETFQRICELAAQRGMTAALEFAPHRKPSTLEEAIGFLDACGCDNAAMMPDPAHLFGSGGKLADLGKIDRRYLLFTQFCGVVLGREEFQPQIGRTAPVVERRPPGEGSLRLAAWLSMLPDGIPISIECPPLPESRAPQEWARELRRLCREELITYWMERQAK